MYQTELTSAEYVSQQGWREATLPSCPLHERGGCGFKRHTAYSRKTPAGTWVARWYCPRGRMTFSMLPSFLAARFPGTLAEVEAGAYAVETAGKVVTAARELRPELSDERSAVRWLRRRTNGVRASLLALVTVLPALCGVPATLVDVRRALGVEAGDVLTEVRRRLEGRLSSLLAPIGFLRRVEARAQRGAVQQQKTGPDPPE